MRLVQDARSVIPPRSASRCASIAVGRPWVNVQIAVAASSMHDAVVHADDIRRHVFAVQAKGSGFAPISGAPLRPGSPAGRAPRSAAAAGSTPR